MTTTTPDLGELLRQFVWNYFREHRDWPPQKKVIVYLDDHDIEPEELRAWELGVFLPHDRDDGVAKLKFEGLLMIAEARALLEPLPALLRLACERFIAEPGYVDGTPKQAVVTSEDFARLWPSPDEGHFAAHLVFECGLSALPFSGGGHGGSWDKIHLYPALSALKYERVQSLDDVLSIKDWSPRLADPKRLAGPQLALVQALFAEGCRDFRWPVPLDFAIRHREIGFVRDLVDELRDSFLQESFSFHRTSRLSLRLAAINYLDGSGEIRKAIPTAARFCGTKWKQAAPGTNSVETSFEEILAGTKLAPELLTATIMACWNEPWISPQWYGPQGQPDVLHMWVSRPAWDFRKVQTWDDYLAVRRKSWPGEMDPDPTYARPFSVDAVVTDMVIASPQADPLADLRAELEKLKSMSSPQERGKAFEKFLTKLFEHFQLEPRGAFVGPSDEVDGSFVLTHQTHLLEAKWLKDPVGKNQVLGLLEKVRKRKSGLTGLFISMSGYAKTVARELTTGHPADCVLLDAKHLEAVLAGHVELPNMLSTLYRLLAETGSPYHGIEAVTGSNGAGGEKPRATTKPKQAHTRKAKTSSPKKAPSVDQPSSVVAKRALTDDEQYEIWAEAVVTALMHGPGNSMKVPPEQMKWASRAVRDQRLEWFRGMPGYVVLPGLVLRGGP